ncbi:MAG: radical SAM protein [Anaerolineae bacterium]|nr:radical SAM protein [Anaerolineae bacterium]
MEAYVIPIEDKYIIYRPLLRLAFVGNQAMADLALSLADNDPSSGADAPGEIVSFLDKIGFLKPDPAPPPAPDPAYRPTTAVLLMTNRCNLRCTYCYANAGVLKPEDLSLELAQTVIDQVCQNAIERSRPHFDMCFHGGGEPTQAWTVMKEATAYARSKELPCKISVVSNGVWSSQQRDWVLNNLDNVTISLDGSPETQDHQRPLASGEGSSRYVMETVAALDAARLPYGLRMTATAPWRGVFPEDVRYLCEHTGCRSIQVEPAFNIRRGEHQESTRKQGEAFVDAFMEAYEIAVQAGRNLVYSGARPWLLTQTFCSAAYEGLIVNAAGHLVTCYEIASDDHLLSDLSTVGQVVDSRIEIDDAARDRLLSMLDSRKPTVCRDCFCRWHCAGDCYTRSRVVEDGQVVDSLARCDTNRAITARLLLWYIMACDGVWRGQSILTYPPAQAEQACATVEACRPL